MADEVPQSLIDFFANANRSSSPATEETLQRIADSLGAKRGPGTGGAGGAGKQAKDQEKLNKQTKKTTDSFEDLMKSATDTEHKFDDLNRELKSGAKDVGRSTMRLADSADGMTDIFKSLGDTTTGVLGNFGKLGRAFGGAVAGVTALGTFAMGAAIKTQENFNTAAQAGANFGGSLLELKQASDQAGVPLEDFTSAIKNNASSLSLFSGTVTAGARDMGALTKAIRSQDLDRSLMSMGIALKDQPEMLAQFMGNMSRFGMDLNDFGGSFDVMARAAVGFRKELEIAKNLTGESNEEQQARLDEAAKDVQLQARLRQMSAADRQSFMEMYNTVPKALQPVMRDIKLFGQATSDSAGVAALYPKQLELMMSAMNSVDPAAAYRQMAEDNSGVLQQELNNSMDAIAISGKTSSEALQQAAGSFVEYQQFVDRLKMGAASAAEQQIEEATDSIVPDELTNAMFTLQNTVIDVKKAFEDLGTTMLGDGAITTLMQAFGDGIGSLAEAMPKVVDKIVQAGNMIGLDPALALLGVAGAAGLAAAVAAPIAAGMAKLAVGIPRAISVGFRRASTAMKSKSGSRTGGMGMGAAGAAGITLGETDSETSDSKSGRKGLFGRFKRGLKGLGKGAGLLGLALGALELGSVITDDSLSTQEKVQQGSGVAGGMGGAVGGAALGAGIGTMIFPGAGTAIGGLVGGAGGYIMGTEAGKAAGKFMTDTWNSWFGDDEEESTPPSGREIPGVRPGPSGAPSAGPSNPSSGAPSPAPTSMMSDESSSETAALSSDQRMQEEQIALLREVVKVMKDGSSSQVDELRKISSTI